MYLKTHELIQEQEVWFVKKGHSQSHIGIVDDLIYKNGGGRAGVRVGRMKVEINDEFIIYCNNLKSGEG